MHHLAALVAPDGSRSFQHDQLVAVARHEQASLRGGPPSEPVEKTWRDSTAVRVALFASGVGAAGVSYARNRSAPTALLHGFMGPAYLAYVGAEALMPPAPATPVLAHTPTFTRRRARRPYTG